MQSNNNNELNLNSEIVVVTESSSEITPLLKKTITQNVNEKTEQKNFLDLLSEFRARLTSIHFPKINMELPKFKVKVPSGQSLIVAANSIPPILDGVGYGTLSFAQLLTTAYTLNLMQANPANLKNWQYLLPLLVLPVFAGIGVTALGIHENKELIEEYFSEASKSEQTKLTILREKIKQALGLLQKHPIETICLALASTVEGMVIYSNLGYTSNQFGVHFKESPLFYPGIALSSVISVQALALNGPKLIELVKKGYSVPKYTDKRNYPILQLLSIALVNILPILSAGSIGALGMAECYELTQYIMNQLDKADIADRIAWLPAFVLGSIYFVCHFALYGREFKAFLADKVLELNEEGLRNFIRENFIPSSDQKAKKLILYPTVGLLVVAALIIGFGALDELGYIIAYSEPPAVPTVNSYHPPIMSLISRIFIYGIPSMALALETYAVEGRKLLKLAHLIKKGDDDRYHNIANLNDLLVKRTNNYYRVEKLLPDILSVVVIGGVKFAIDWFYMPDYISANEITLRDSILIASVVGLMSMGRYGVINAYNYSQHYYYQKNENERLTALLLNKELGKNKSETEKASDEIKAQYISILPEKVPQEKNLDTTKPDTFDKTPLPTRKLIRNIAMIGLFATGVTMGSELLTRYFILDEVGKEEEKDRVNNAQILGALAGGIAGVYAEPCFNFVKDQTVKAFTKTYSFFRSGRNIPSLHPNSTVQSVRNMNAYNFGE